MPKPESIFRTGTYSHTGMSLTIARTAEAFVITADDGCGVRRSYHFDHNGVFSHLSLLSGPAGKIVPDLAVEIERRANEIVKSWLETNMKETARKVVMELWEKTPHQISPKPSEPGSTP
jgi:hypothetical protein